MCEGRGRGGGCVAAARDDGAFLEAAQAGRRLAGRGDRHRFGLGSSAFDRLARPRRDSRRVAREIDGDPLAAEHLACGPDLEQFVAGFDLDSVLEPIGHCHVEVVEDGRCCLSGRRRRRTLSR